MRNYNKDAKAIQAAGEKAASESEYGQGAKAAGKAATRKLREQQGKVRKKGTTSPAVMSGIKALRGRKGKLKKAMEDALR